METLHEKRVGNYLIEVVYDECPDNPRNWDNGGTMVCFHKRYKLGDKTDYTSDMFNSWEELKNAIIEEHNPESILPLYLYDHSGITISTTPFGDRWDSGQIGFIYGEGNLKSEVEVYDKYLTGQVYGYRINEIKKCNEGHEHAKNIDSCFGFYDDEECLNEAILTLSNI